MARELFNDGILYPRQILHLPSPHSNHRNHTFPLCFLLLFSLFFHISPFNVWLMKLFMVYVWCIFIIQEVREKVNTKYYKFSDFYNRMEKHRTPVLHVQQRDPQNARVSF